MGGALAGAAFGAAEYVFRQMTGPRRTGQALGYGFTPFETGVTWEDVSFAAEDGTRLGGWLLLRGDEAPAIVACGGYRNRRSDLLGIGSSLWRNGFNVLLFDYRGHGDEPAPVTLGYHEVVDAQAAVRFLRQRLPAAAIGAIGFSMGASIAIMLAAREREVRAVLADSPFASQREIVRHHMIARFGMRSSPVFPDPVWLRAGHQLWAPLRVRWAERFPRARAADSGMASNGAELLSSGAVGPDRVGPSTERAAPLTRVILWLVERRLARQFGFRFDDVHPLRDVARLAPRPLLLVHGEADPVVPLDHSLRLAAAARAAGVLVETWFLPGIGHCGAYFVDRAHYCRRAAEFFRQHVQARTGAVVGHG
jgi:fermentation-respiration switch protein FrsA (DUF1100 family)